MANERITEEIVRKHFRNDNSIIKIEEQKSYILKIDKLLKSASKKGDGKGRPDFIITFNNNNNLLIVIECKSDITKHENHSKDKFAEYAVDGALLYASFLSKEYDVLAIAVSGEKQEQLKVSHFLHLKAERKATPMFGNQLLSAQDYLTGYLKSPEKFRQDYSTLLAYTKLLNKKLHTNKIPENNRALLLSCILIALEDDAFRISYDKKATPKSLADFLTTTVSEKLESENLDSKKLENLNIQFGFIKTDTSLSTKNGLLKELIDEIDANINQFIKTHEYFDVLGQLYMEFLRYANSDRSLGIVLTPPHITELFAKLAQVNKNSIVYDNCAGTGGFLVSAMKYMVEDAQDDGKKIKEIKDNQLIGTEYQSQIYALAVSNMYIHQDGKTNVINGDCFDNDVMNFVKNKRPTVGVLNPPYQSDKKNDTDELDFILNNLECLVDGGTCIAIVPMQKALATNGKIAELKQKLLNKHTLEAVLSMPDELFFNSDVNVVTCVMIFTAHKKHSPNKKTYFGYYKDDGFIKRKIQGRYDGLNYWETIKNKWIGYFLDENRKEEAGFSVNKIVSAKDEWCVEAYMETNYVLLNHLTLECKFKEYLAFKFLNNVDIKTIKLPDIKIGNIKELEMVKISDIFEIKNSQSLELLNCEQTEDGIYFVSRTSKNNGIAAKIEPLDDLKPMPAGAITVAMSGSVLSSFYQDKPFYTAYHIASLYPKQPLAIEEMIFYACAIEQNKYRYSFGRQANKTLKDLLIPKLNTKYEKKRENYLLTGTS
jgi:type I restriction-modification system DNA methylase subunit